MANDIVHPRGYLTRRAMVPSKASYVGAWLWDNALHAIAYRHIDPELARDQIRGMLAQQQSDSILPGAIFDDDGDGIVQYTHPYSSRLDDSPLWDHGMPVESPDINTYLQIQMSSLATIAEAIGKRDKARRWRENAATLTARMIEHLWDEKSGTFRPLHNENPVSVLTPFNLLPLWTAQLPARYNDRLVEHLRNPDEFMGKFTLHSVAYNDPLYDHQKMWRGPVWANVNYFYVEALQNIGWHALADELREHTLEMIASQPGISEFYDSMTGIAPTTSVPAFGWTAAVFIELVIQASRNSAEKKQVEKDHEG